MVGRSRAWETTTSTFFYQDSPGSSASHFLWKARPTKWLQKDTGLLDDAILFCGCSVFVLRVGWVNVVTIEGAS